MCRASRNVYDLNFNDARVKARRLLRRCPFLQAGEGIFALQISSMQMSEGAAVVAIFRDGEEAAGARTLVRATRAIITRWWLPCRNVFIRLKASPRLQPAGGTHVKMVISGWTEAPELHPARECPRGAISVNGLAAWSCAAVAAARSRRARMRGGKGWRKRRRHGGKRRRQWSQAPQA